MILKIYTQESNSDLDRVTELADKLEEEGHTVERYDIDQPDAHLTAGIYEILETPSFVITQNDGREIKSWKGSIPPTSDLKIYLQQ